MGKTTPDPGRRSLFRGLARQLGGFPRGFDREEEQRLAEAEEDLASIRSTLQTVADEGVSDRQLVIEKLERAQRHQEAAR